MTAQIKSEYDCPNQVRTNEKRGRSIGFSPAWIVRNESGFSLNGYGYSQPLSQSNAAVAENAAQSEM